MVKYFFTLTFVPEKVILQQNQSDYFSLIQIMQSA